MSNTTATIRLALISHFARSTRLKVRYFLLRFPPLIGTLFVSDFLGSVVLENLVPESSRGGHHCLLKLIYLVMTSTLRRLVCVLINRTIQELSLILKHFELWACQRISSRTYTLNEKRESKLRMDLNGLATCITIRNNSMVILSDRCNC